MTGNIKALLVLVIVMGVMLVVGTIALAVAIAQKLGGADQQPAVTASIAVAPGTQIMNASSDGRRLVLLEMVNGHQQIELRAMDGRLITRYAIATAP